MSKQENASTQLIKLAASSAICGLTISFILGELVDQQGRLLLRQSNDYKIIPSEYAPIQPIKVLDAFIFGTSWEERLTQVNSMEVLQETLLASTFKVDESKIRSLSAAPVVSGIRNQSQPTTPIVSPIYNREFEKRSNLKIESSFSAEKVSLTISRASAKIAQPSETTQTPPAKNLGMATSPLNSQTVVATEPTPVRPETSEWTIKGTILNVPAVAFQEGHFEVGAFTKIDPEGLPIGFPIYKETLPAGKASFQLKISRKADNVYVYGQYFAKKTGTKSWVPATVNPILQSKYNINMVDLMWNKEDTISMTAASPTKGPDKDSFNIVGQVSTMFVRGKKIPQEDVLIKVRGRKEATRTNAEGVFTLSLPPYQGAIVLEVMKKGYLPTLLAVDNEDKKKLQIELSSRDAINQYAQRFALAQSQNKGVFVGQIDGEVKEGYRAQLSLPSDGPYYFDERGFPNSDLRQTTKDGRFIYFNVESGAGYLDFNVKNEIIAPLAVSVIDGGEMVNRNIAFTSHQIKGRIFNPITENGKLAPLSGALVRLSGSSDWITSDQMGNFSFPTQSYVKAENTNLEVSMKGFHSHRFVVRHKALEQKQAVNLYAFPANYLTQLARTMDVDIDPIAGVVIGKVLGDLPVRIDAMSDHSAYNNARDFYFDKKGRLLGANNMTDPKYGTYIIFNVPKGRTMLQGSDANGVLRVQSSVLMSESSITVLAD